MQSYNYNWFKCHTNQQKKNTWWLWNCIDQLDNLYCSQVIYIYSTTVAVAFGQLHTGESGRVLSGSTCRGAARAWAPKSWGARMALMTRAHGLASLGRFGSRWCQPWRPGHVLSVGGDRIPLTEIIMAWVSRRAAAELLTGRRKEGISCWSKEPRNPSFWLTLCAVHIWFCIASCSDKLAACMSNPVRYGYKICIMHGQH